MKRIVYPATLLACALAANAQVIEEHIEHDVKIGVAGAAAMPASGVVQFISSEFSWEAQAVKGAPFSADSSTETVQALGDGTRITHKNTSAIFRDSEGRTRREQNVESIGPWASGQTHKLIFINDPVSNINYSIDPQERTVRKMTVNRKVTGVPPMAEAGQRTMVVDAGPGPGERMAVGEGQQVFFRTMVDRVGGSDPNPPKTESLGKRTIEGVECEGTRTTVTIPVGTIGNDRPIESVTERWFSPELKMTILSQRSDPRLGQTTTRLTNIRRGEQSRSLFDPPSDYTVKEGNLQFRIERKKQE